MMPDFIGLSQVCQQTVVLQCYSWTSSISIENIVRNSKFIIWVTTDLISEAVRAGPRDLCFNKPCRWFWHMLKFENNYARI